MLLDKIKEWNDADDFDYSKYLTEDGLDCKEILSDFKKAVNIMDELEYSKEIDSALENYFFFIKNYIKTFIFIIN